MTGKAPTRTARRRATLLSRSEQAWPLLVVLGAVLLANLPAIVGRVTTSPLLLDGFLAHVPAGHLPGVPSIDPNAGYTSQALGHLAALDWLHGHVPWWNPYEGIGSPLAGEMQGGAFFPPNLLLALPHGTLLLQILLELVAGWSTCFLVRRLGIGRLFSTTAGVAFGLCGTFAWFAYAPVRAMALLPLTLIGVERAIDAAHNRRRGGWRLLALSLALAILAGFPETTLIDGTFMLVWATVRIATRTDTGTWRRAAAKVGGGSLVGAGLAAPLLVAFVDFLPHADTGGHGLFSQVSLPSLGLTQTILPYSLGPIFGFGGSGGGDRITLLWGSVGGFLSATLVAAGLVGLVGRRLRTLRLVLGAWIALCLLRTFGFPPVVHVMAAIPGLRLTAFYRYADPTWELAAVVLAVLGLDDVVRGATRYRVLAASGLVTASLAAWAAVTAWGMLPPGASNPGAWGTRARLYPLASLGLAVGALIVLTVGGVAATRRPGTRSPRRRHAGVRGAGTRRVGTIAMAGALCTESVLLVGVTSLSAPAPTALQTGSVHWLQAHLGTSRFTTLGPIQPDYGSYFHIAEVNTNDLPLAKSWTHYVTARLDPNTSGPGFTGGIAEDPTGLSPAQALSRNVAAFEAVGVRYVVEQSSGTDVLGHPFPGPAARSWPSGPRLVYRDAFAEIWELPSPSPIFGTAPLASTRGAGNPLDASACAVHWTGWDRATARCARPAELVRREQSMPGWYASVDGSPATVGHGGPEGLFQTVALPAGTSRVTFTFLPPYEVPAFLASLAALLALAVSFLAARLEERRARRHFARLVGAPAPAPASDPEPDAEPASAGAGPALDRIARPEGRGSPSP